ncbi:MAG: RhuM family protein, partial [Patescibacteria group bacterium]
MSKKDSPSENSYPIILYQTEDGKTKIDVRIKDETVWLTHAQMSELFQKSIPTISEHISNIYKEGELVKNTTFRNFRMVQKEGSKNVERFLDHYNLDVIISVGYRVRSIRGTQFRIWATQALREFIVKGFVMDDERMKQGPTYFRELEERVREIRLSERNLYQKVKDIFALSSDYFPSSEAAVMFFKSMQSKFEYAITGKTSPEIIKDRIGSDKDHCGLTNWQGSDPTVPEAKVAKNYLLRLELRQLALLVESFLALAEFYVARGSPMAMEDWIVKLNTFLKSNELAAQDDGGKVSRKSVDKIVK